MAVRLLNRAGIDAHLRNLGTKLKAVVSLILRPLYPLETFSMVEGKEMKRGNISKA
jgi:hypothetical protein